MGESSLNQFDQFSEDELSEIAGRIMYIRKNVLHLTQKEFSEALGISQSFLSQIESGNRIIPADVVIKINQVFHFPPSYILYGMDLNISSNSSTVFEKNYHQMDALKNMEAAFDLKKTDLELLKWYCSLDEARRSALYGSIQVLLATDKQ